MTRIVTLTKLIGLSNFFENICFWKSLWHGLVRCLSLPSCISRSSDVYLLGGTEYSAHAMALRLLHPLRLLAQILRPSDGDSNAKLKGAVWEQGSATYNGQINGSGRYF